MTAARLKRIALPNRRCDRVARDERVDRVASDAEQVGNLRHVEDVRDLSDGMVARLRRQWCKRCLHDCLVGIGGGHGYATSVRAVSGAGVNAL